MGQVDIIHPMSKPQLEFLTTPCKSVAAVAGFGSGKTEVAMHRAFNTLFRYPGADVLYLAPTFPLISDIWYPKAEDFLVNTLGFTSKDFRIHLTKHIIDIYGFGKVYCRTMEHPHRIIGFEVLDAFLDELDTLPTQKALEVWRKAKARCRQKISGKTNQMFVTTTPEGFKATYKLFKENPLENSALIQMSTYSNQHNLPEDYIDELKSNYPPQLIEAYIMGEFVNLASGRVYPCFNRETNHADVGIQEKEPIYIGMDFNVGNMSAVIHVMRQGRPVAAEEITEGIDTPSMIEIIKERYTDRMILVYPDASGNARATQNAAVSDLNLLTQAGFQVRVGYTNPAVKDRVNSMNAMFLNSDGIRRYYVNTNNCPEYTKALEQQAYDKNGRPDKQNGYDHLPDAGGYYIEREFGISKPSATVDRVIM